MKRVEFARLCEIAPSMVTKYTEQGFVVFSAPKVVNAAATLAALAGRLDEPKRQAALARLASGEIPAAPAANDTPAPAPATRNAKTALDELRRDAVALDLARKAGDVVPIVDVEAAIQEAVSALQNAFDIETRACADQLTIDLGLAADRSAMLTRRLRSLSTRARARFAAELAKLAGDEPAAEPARSDDKAADA